MIQFLDTEFNGVRCYPLFFYLAVFCLAGIRDMFVYFLNVLDIYVALFKVLVLFGQAE